jgi:hypothetical protein
MAGPTEPDWQAMIAEARARRGLSGPSAEGVAEPDRKTREKADRAATRGLALGIAAVLTSILLGVGGVLGLIAIWFAGSPLNNETLRKGQAYGGIACGFVAIVLSIALWVLLSSLDTGPGY